MPISNDEHTSPLLDKYSHASCEASTPGSPRLPIAEKHVSHAREVNHAVTICRNAVQSLSLSLVPSFLRRTPRGSSTKQQNLHPTAYLDGLRGTAAFIVFIHHSIIDWFPALSSGYGSGDAATSLYYLQLPIIRVVYSGRGMVAVFFVISGYVLSYKAARMIHERQFVRLLETLASSTFRRGLRLYVPCLVSTFVSMLLCRAGWYRHDPLMRNTLPVVMASLREQLHDWAFHVYLLINPFQIVDGRNLYSPPYDGHLWTIPIEFYGSMIVFIVLLCLSKAAPTVRLVLLIDLVILALWVGSWHIFLFLTGTLFCNIHFLLTVQVGSLVSLPTSVSTTRKTTQARIVHLMAGVTFVISLWILSFPDENASSSPGYIMMIAWTPNLYLVLQIVQRFWLAIGAVLLFLSISLSPFLQSVFSSALPQYLGKISFALYIVHGPILYTLGMKMLLPAVDQVSDGPRYAAAFVGAMIINLTVCFWAADFFWRQVDMRSVAFSGWIQRKAWIKED